MDIFWVRSWRLRAKIERLNPAMLGNFRNWQPSVGHGLDFEANVHRGFITIRSKKKQRKTLSYSGVPFIFVNSSR